MNARSTPSLGRHLVREGRLSNAQLFEALSEQQKRGRHLAYILVAMGLVPQDEMLAIQSERLGLPVCPDAWLLPERDVERPALPAGLVARYQMAPIAARPDGAIVVAVHDPRLIDLLRAEGARLAASLVPALAPAGAIEAVLSRLYPEAIVRAEPAGGPVLAVDATPATAPVAVKHVATPPAAVPAPPVVAVDTSSPLPERTDGPLKINDVGAAAEQFYEATSLAEAAKIAAGFARSYFDRVYVLDLRVPVCLASTHEAPAPVLAAFAEGQSLRETLSTRAGYYGRAGLSPDWQRLYHALGGAVPGGMWVAGLYQGDSPAVLLYGDHARRDRYEDLSDLDVLLGEFASALGVLGL